MPGARAKKTGMLIAGLLITLAGALFVHRTDVKRVREEFLLQCKDIRIRVLTRLEAHEQLLQAASAYFEASDTVTSEEWKDFVENSNILNDLPGVQGIGFISAEHADENGFKTSIIYVEPFDWRNRRVPGYDMYSEPARRKAMDHACDSASAALTGKVDLIQEMVGPDQAGTIMFVPVYKKGKHKVAADLRRASIAGWIFTPYRMDDLIRGILGDDHNANLHIRLFADSASRENLLFESSGYKERNKMAGSAEASMQINFNGTVWILDVDGESTFFALWGRAMSLFAAGFVLILLLFHLYVSLLLTRLTAQHMKGELTRDLMVSEEKYRLMAENISDLIWIMNLNTLRFIYVSPSVYRLTGYTVEEAMNLDLESWLGDDVAKAVTKLIGDRIPEFIENPGVCKYYYDELLQSSKNGEKVWIEVMSHFQYSKSGEIEIFGVSRNIDERKKDEQQLKQSEKNLRQLNATRDRLFSIIAHDLRSPFSSILGFTEIISDCCRKNDTEKALRLTKTVNAAAGQTLLLLENLLEWARNQTGEPEFKPDHCLLNPVVSRITAVLKTTAEIKRITVENVIDPGDLIVFADMNMLEFIIRNLLSNALKFTHPGGRIIIGAARENGVVNVYVEDNGIGMSDDLKRRLLDTDEHISQSGTLSEKGSGLGLLLCKDFIRQHGSFLTIESAPGKGSLFSFVLNEVNAGSTVLRNRNNQTSSI